MATPDSWRSFFVEVRDAFEGFAADIGPGPTTQAHSRGCKAWFGAETREHYEAQLVRVDGDVVLEIGFHAEHRDGAANRQLLAGMGDAVDWRKALGADAVGGDFLGNTVWQRISEVWPSTPADPEMAIEAAARLAEYARTLEPARTSLVLGT